MPNVISIFSFKVLWVYYNIPQLFQLNIKCELHTLIFKHSDMQWILVAAEETFAIPENLRFYVAAKNASDQHYLGHAMKFWNVIYNWADAGYILSKGSLNKFIEKFDSDSACDKGGQYWKNSDWYLAKHLSEMKIKPVDTRDHIGRSRFIGKYDLPYSRQ